MMHVCRNFLDKELLEEFKMHIVDEFAIPNSRLIVPGKRSSRHLLPEEFIPDEMFLKLFRHFSEFAGYMAGIDGFFTISEKQPKDLELDMHTDAQAYGWSPDVKSLTVWIPLSEISRTKAPGLVVEGTAPELNIGDCIIFDQDVPHGTYCSDKQTEVRYSIDFRLLDLTALPPIPKNARVSKYPFKRMGRINYD